MSLDALKADSFLKRFVERRARSYGRLPEGEIKLVIPMAGVRSIVRLVEIDGVTRAVVRLYSRREKATIDRRVQADALVEDRGLASPRLLDVYGNGRNRITAVMEEYVSGNHPNPATVDERQAQAIAETFMRLHAVRSPRYGLLGATRSGNYAREAFHRARNRMKSVWRWAPAQIERSDKRRVRRWFRDWSRRFVEIREYSLIHDKPNVGNVVWDGQKQRIVLIDLTTLGYGCPAKDLVQVEHEILNERSDSIERMRSVYFAQWDSSAIARYDAFLPYHHAYYHLCECAINCRRESKHADNLDRFGSNFVRKSLDHWRALTEIVDANPS